MTTLRDAAQQALEALIAATPVKAKDPQMQADAIVALRAALAEPAEQEPVAWALTMPDGVRLIYTTEEASRRAEAKWPEAYAGCQHVPLYLAPQAPPVEWFVQWIRNNYQNHPNIASLCDAMRESAHGITKE